jgi:Zn-dependent protease
MRAPLGNDEIAAMAMQRPWLRWMLRFGAPGLMAVALLIRVEALVPLAALKSKTLPLLLVGCAEMSWLFGGQIGLLIAAQWLIHELAHVHAAQRHGLTPGWRSFIPFIGVYAGTTPQSFGSREAEAEVALAGVLAGLIAASGLYGYGALSDIPEMVAAAKFGFLFNLVNLLPFRPFDGGRIFPGYLWRYVGDTATGEGDDASRRFIAGCRRLVERIMPPRGPARDNRVVLAEALNAVLFGVAGVVALACIVLPPLAFVISMLLGIVLIWWFIAALITLDPRAVAARSTGELKPRRSGRGEAVALAAPLPWRDARASRAALGIYAVSVTALSYGAFGL